MKVNTEKLSQHIKGAPPLYEIEGQKFVAMQQEFYPAKGTGWKKIFDIGAWKFWGHAKCNGARLWDKLVELGIIYLPYRQEGE